MIQYILVPSVIEDPQLAANCGIFVTNALYRQEVPMRFFFLNHLVILYSARIFSSPPLGLCILLESIFFFVSTCHSFSIIFSLFILLSALLFILSILISLVYRIHFFMIKLRNCSHLFNNNMIDGIYFPVLGFV